MEIIGGQVHLKVREGKDLWDASLAGKKNYDPYITVRVVGIKHKKLQTSIYKKTTSPDPTWYEEFVMSIVDVNTPILLKVWNDKFGIGKEPLGYAKINLSNIQPNQSHPVYLTLEESTSKGSLYVNICFTPQPVSTKLSKQVFMKLKNRRFILEKNSYLAGETIIGVFLVNLMRPTSIANIYMNIRGKQKVRTKRSKQSLYERKVFIFTVVVPLMQKSEQDDDVIKLPGFYSFPFRFTLPTNISPTFTYNLIPNITRIYANTSYEFCGKVDCHKSNKWVSQSFNVNVDCKPLPIVVLKEGKQPVNINAKFTQLPLYIDTINKLEISIENLSAHKVIWISVTLLQKYIVHSSNHPHVDLKELQKIKNLDKSIFPIMGGNTSQFNVGITFPLVKTIPTLPSIYSPLFQIEHYVKIKAHLSGGKKVCISFPTHIVKTIHAVNNNLNQMEKPKLELIRNSSFVLDGISLINDPDDYTNTNFSESPRNSDNLFTSISDSPIIVSPANNSETPGNPNSVGSPQMRLQSNTPLLTQSPSTKPRSLSTNVQADYDKQPEKLKRSLSHNHLTAKNKQDLEKNDSDKRKLEYLQVPRRGSFVFLEEFEQIDIDKFMNIDLEE